MAYVIVQVKQHRTRSYGKLLTKGWCHACLLMPIPALGRGLATLMQTWDMERCAPLSPLPCMVPATFLPPPVLYKQKTSSESMLMPSQAQPICFRSLNKSLLLYWLDCVCVPASANITAGCIVCSSLLPFHGLSFPFFSFNGFRCCAKPCKFDYVPFVHFCFYVCGLERLT